MRDFGLKLGKQLRAGDYLVLNGELGAGKTTFTQGLGAGLSVIGSVTSPTFVVSRIHKSTNQGPELIHIDAYRLTSGDQLNDLDLEDHPNSVVVMEWGLPFIEVLTDTWLQLDISRNDAEQSLELNQTKMDESDPASGDRIVQVTAFGNRWKELDVSVLQ